MRTVVVYRSRLGTTRRYARWLQEALEADLSKAGAGRRSARDYDLIIICSPTYLGRISLLGYLRERWPVLKDKWVILVAVGLAPPAGTHSRRSCQGVPEDIRSRVRYFELPGSIGPAGRGRVRPENLRPVLEYIRSIHG